MTCITTEYGPVNLAWNGEPKVGNNDSTQSPRQNDFGHRTTESYAGQFLYYHLPF